MTEVPVDLDIAVAMFEGEYIDEMEAILPSIKLQLPEGYTRGTVLRLNVEVHVKSVGHDEVGTKAVKLVRIHKLALDEVTLVAAFQPDQVQDSVGGSASAQSVPTPEETEELGIEIGRSSETWGSPIDPAAGF